MNLEKRIVYIDCFENDERIKNVGHVKIWIQDPNCIVDIHIKGLHETDTLMAELKGINEEISIGRICIDKGTAYFNNTFPMNNVDGKGNRFQDLKGLHIKLSDSRYLEGRWEEEGIESNVKKMVDVKPVEKRFEKPLEEETEKKSEAISAAEHTVSLAKTHMYDDKWTQLCHSYPVVHPFVEQDYISIKPKDFTILRREYQQLVNNSFLLHGFYNYQHIILGKSEKKGKEVFLLGVPGTYFEREKMAAIMFGFESFEVSEQEFSDESIQEGTFGYYLRVVDI